jgi:cell division transport system permease protein
VRFRTVVGEAWRSFAANASTTVAATMTVLIAMVILGLSIGLGSWVLSWSNHVKKGLVVNVFFCTRLDGGVCHEKLATRRQEEAVGNFLAKIPHVKSVTFVSKTEALKIMQRKNKVLATAAEDLPSNPLPDGFRVVPTRGDYVDEVASKVPRGSGSGVAEVRYGKTISRRVLRVARWIETVFLVTVIVLLVASTMLIANTIRLSIFSRRREIEVMKLVGATNWFVRGPFMLEGVICGVVGSLAAVILLLLGKEIALHQIFSHIGNSSDVHAWPFELNALILLGFGLVLGAAGSGVTIRRFLRI